MNSTRLNKIKRIALLALMLALTIIFCFVPIQFGAITLALMILPTIVVAQTCSFSTSIFMALMMGIINYIAWFTTKAASPVAPIFQNPLVCILPRVLIGVVSYLSRVGLEKLFFPASEIARKYKDEYHLEKVLVCLDDKSDISSDCVSQNECDLQGVYPSENNENATYNFDIATSCEEAETFNNTATSIHTQNQNKNYSHERAKDTLKSQIICAISTALGVVTNTLFVALFTLIFFNDTSIGQNTIVTVDYVLAWFGLNFAIEVVSFSLITPPIVLALKASKLVK